MNTFNKFVLVLAALAAFACGSENTVVNGNTPEEQASEDIGQTEEAINIGNGGYGFTNATSQLRCAQPGVNGQVCFASAVKKTAAYCFTGSPSLTNTEKAVIDQSMQLMNAQTTNWHLALGAFPCDIVFQKSTSQAGSTSANIENFMTATPGGTLTPLTSPAGTSHVNGTWKSFTSLSVVLFLDKLSIVAAPAPAQQVLRHMSKHAAALYMGLGTQQDPSGTVSPTRRLVDFNNTVGPSDLTAGEKCRANNESVGTPTQISAVFGCGF